MAERLAWTALVAVAAAEVGWLACLAWLAWRG